MITLLLYLTVVMIWGSSWIAVKFQVGVVPAEASVAYRIGIAACFMFAWTLLRRLPLRFTLGDHLFMALQGALIFSSNFFLFYLAAGYLTTGLIAVVCSTSTGMIMLFNAVILRQRPALRMVLGALLGFIGISIIFKPELVRFTLVSGAGLGLLLSVGGTICFSLGSIVSARNRKAGLSVRGNTAWAMLYGFILLTLFLYCRGRQFSFDPRLPYIGSLLYLSVVGSVIAFAAYFALLGRIEPARAAYVTVLFPIVALSLSTLFEGYHWTITALFGVLLTLLGNFLVLFAPTVRTASNLKCLDKP